MFYINESNHNIITSWLKLKLMRIYKNLKIIYHIFLHIKGFSMIFNTQF